MDKPVIRAIFSDLDGTLIHFPIWFEKHGVSMSDADHEKHSAIVTNAQGESRRCRLLPKTTMGDGVVSDRTVELVAQLRKAGVLFFIVTGARKSTVLERLPFLPDADAVVGESGSRMYVEGKLDEEWQQRLLPVCGPIDRAMDPESRPEPLWKFCSLLKARGAPPRKIEPLCLSLSHTRSHGASFVSRHIHTLSLRPRALSASASMLNHARACAP
uniref:Sucrose phosphatase-like domain-containing protein n=1 Tax=Chrysotila carterae TaxID=13221 RepID=A0A7S4BQQ5_CHRCT